MEDPKMIDQTEAAAQMQRATLAQVKRQIEFAKSMAKRRRGTRHAPGATKATIEKRKATSRKRSRAAGQSRRKNR